MSESLLIPGAARVAAGAFVVGAGLVGGLWAWTSRTPLPPPPQTQPVVLWPSEPETATTPIATPAAIPRTTTEAATPDPAGDPPPAVAPAPENTAPENTAPGPTPLPITPASEPESESDAVPEEELPSMPIDAGPATAVPSTPKPSGSTPVAPAVQLIGINSASSAELQLLPGIGPVLAQRIVDDRAANGRFGSLNDLQRVKGIGEKTAAKLAPLITFD